MATDTKFASHGDYIAAAAPEVQAVLRQIGEVVAAKVPQAVACISYNMPAFEMGRTFFYFAAFKRHIGVYPPVTHERRLIDELAAFRNEKGNLSFPLKDPIPYQLIGRVAEALATQYASAGPKRQARR